MVKPSSSSSKDSAEFPSSSSSSYRGVRKRKWGKWVSEIRLPNSRERIWLGSYDTPEKAAKAFDAALFCLRGKSANFNFPENPPEILNGRSMTPTEIQAAAARFANDSENRAGPRENSDHSSSEEEEMFRAESPSVSVTESEKTEMTLDNGYMDMFSSLGKINDMSDFANNLNNSANRAGPRENSDPCSSSSPSVSDRVESERTEMTLDNGFMDMFSSMGTVNNMSDFGIFPGFDDLSGEFFVPPEQQMPNLESSSEEVNYLNYDDGFQSQGGSSYLWNF